MLSVLITAYIKPDSMLYKLANSFYANFCFNYLISVYSVHPPKQLIYLICDLTENTEN